MNIYLHVESIPRELDSKLLLATIASAKGHDVLVSNLGGITRGVRNRVLVPGIFHTKSLSPGERKIARHKEITDKGCLISSIDEEGGLVDSDYLKFAKSRYSDQTIAQSSAVFCWGSQDNETLKQIYPKHSSKMYKTGSPRADLWKSNFSNYWDVPKGKPNKPYLLISSSMSFTNNVHRFHKVITNNKRAGYYDRDPDLFYRHFGALAEETQMIAEFIKAIKYVAQNNNGYDIVLRPHLNEKIEAWKVFLEDTPNVHVIRNGPINAWVNNAFAIMHNGCTTALEATVSGKPVITYIPFKQKYPRDIPNKLGILVLSQEDLSQKVNSIFKNIENKDKLENSSQIPKILSNKIYLDKNELAAEKIIKVWENLENYNLLKNNNWVRYKLFLNIMKLKDLFIIFLKKLFPKKFGTHKVNHKFPPFKKNEIYNRIKKFKKILGIDKNIECKFISDKTILIKMKD